MSIDQKLNTFDQPGPSNLAPTAIPSFTGHEFDHIRNPSDQKFIKCIHKALLNVNELVQQHARFKKSIPKETLEALRLLESNTENFSISYENKNSVLNICYDDETDPNSPVSRTLFFIDKSFKTLDQLKNIDSSNREWRLDSFPSWKLVYADAIKFLNAAIEPNSMSMLQQQNTFSSSEVMQAYQKKQILQGLYHIYQVFFTKLSAFYPAQSNINQAPNLLITDMRLALKLLSSILNQSIKKKSLHIEIFLDETDSILKPSTDMANYFRYWAYTYTNAINALGGGAFWPIHQHIVQDGISNKTDSCVKMPIKRSKDDSSS